MKSHYLLVTVLIITTLLVYRICASSEVLNKIDTKLLFSLEKGETANILLHMKDSTKLVLNKLKQRESISRSARVNTITNELKILSENSQELVKNFLEQNSITYKSYWICNQIYIPGANVSLVEKLSELPEISTISREITFQLNPPEIIDVIKNPSVSKQNIPWGINKIQADAAWARKVTGEGIIVGVIDTGVRRSHIDLQNNYRHEYGWYDPTNYTQLPYDDNGHGTHVTGTIVGANGIGIAPGAKWIACKALSSNGGGLESDMFECGQFMLCPHLTNGAFPNCSMAPHIVSNSWSWPGKNSFFETVVDAWVTAGIIPFFEIGDEGPKCGTLRSPAYYTNVIAVGATTQNDSLVSSSSRGASWTNEIFKPDITAPGYDIVSASHTNDTEYISMGGTGMACSHAAGMGALILSLKNDLTFEEFKTLLFSSVDTEQLISPSTYCGSEVDSLYPNNAFGHGRINAFKAVMALSNGNIVSRSDLLFWVTLKVILYYTLAFSQNFYT